MSGEKCKLPYESKYLISASNTGVKLSMDLSLIFSAFSFFFGRSDFCRCGISRISKQRSYLNLRLQATLFLFLLYFVRHACCMRCNVMSGTNRSPNPSCLQGFFLIFLYFAIMRPILQKKFTKKKTYDMLFWWFSIWTVLATPSTSRCPSSLVPSHRNLPRLRRSLQRFPATEGRARLNQGWWRRAKIQGRK